MARIGMSPVLALFLLAALVSVSNSMSSSSTSGTTEIPQETTEEPQVTTEEPQVTTEEPQVTTEEPQMTTEEPQVTTEEPQVTTEAPEVTTLEVDASDCARCDYTKGQVWLPDLTNCHLYYVCEPLGEGKYRKHHATCGEYYWDQEAHTCVEEPIPGIPCGPVVTYPVISTTKAPCPFEANAANPNEYFVIGVPEVSLYCVPGLVFINDPICSCMPDGSPIDPTCSDDLLLHFPFDDHFDDVTCHKAIGTKCGEDLEIVDMGRDSNVACFDGGYLEVAFLRTWFARNDVENFTISLWFKSDDLSVSSSLVNNGDCEDEGSFEINVSDAVVGGVSAEGSGHVILDPIMFNDNNWHHVAWVYDGSDLELYLDHSAVSDESAAGYMLNPDAPMYVAFLNGVVFKGCIDDLRVYTRALDSDERLDLFNIP